jgi:hypothetical protein
MFVFVPEMVAEAIVEGDCVELWRVNKGSR